VYAGRICEGKGCSKLFEFFIQYKKDNPSNLKLILMGKTDMPVPRHPDIAALGFISEEDKYDGMAGAKMLVLPSQYESLSIVVLESLALGVPVVVNGNCEVLRGHCRKSNAGLYYQTYREFEGILNYLLSHTDAYTAMRENGKKYVAKSYNWDKIINKLCSMIENITEQHIGVNPNNYANHGRRQSCT
jgi:glycosyltransferase involved in cell wall biosynthesis